MPEAAWDEDRSRSWLSNIDAREHQLEPISDAMFSAADLLPGERVLDVGCGSGVTTARAAGLVAPEVGGHPAALEDTGRVVGTDVSPTMIATAQERHHRAAIDWLVADAETHDFGAGAFDVVLSRFGVMFFADPATAFANLAASCRQGGRLVMTVWQRRSLVDCFAVPLEITLATLDRLSVPHRPPPPGDQGPYSLSDDHHVTELLRGAGWADVSCRSDTRPIHLGGPGGPSHAVDAALSAHAVEYVLEGQPETVIAHVRQALTQMAIDRHDGAGVPLAGGVWVVTAVRP